MEGYDDGDDDDDGDYKFKDIMRMIMMLTDL